MALRTLLETVAHFLVFVFRTFLDLPSCFVSRFSNWVQHLFPILIFALPLALVAGVAIGAVVTMHLRGALVLVGGPSSVTYLPQALALAVVLEFGPMTSALLVAGRTGASLGAELASMRQTEQIDALEVLGFSAMKELITPRVVATMVALPLLTIFISYLALLSGSLAETIGGSLSWNQFWTETMRVLSTKDMMGAILKSIVFGFWTGVAGSYFGFHACEGTIGIGKAATSGVVSSIFLVLVSDIFLVKLLQIAN